MWGGVTQAGADCSGFIQTIFGNAGVSLPRTSEEMASSGTAVASLADASPGDLLLYDYEGPNSHVAVYAGNGMQYAETDPAGGLQYQPVDTSALDAIRNVLGTNQTATLTDSQEDPGGGATVPATGGGNQMSASDTSSAHSMLVVVGVCVLFIYGLVEVAGTSDAMADIAGLTLVGILLLMGYQYWSRGATFLSTFFGSTT